MRPERPSRKHHHHHHSFECRENNWRCKHRSIFVRLVFILIGMTLLVHLFVGGFFGLMTKSESKQPLAENIAQYVDLIARDIGSPPDTLKAKMYAEELLIEIRYENSEYTWATATDIPLINEVKDAEDYHLHQVVMPKWRHSFVVENDDGSKILLYWQMRPIRDMRSQLLMGLLAILTFIFLLTHILIRKSLLPVRWIQKGVDQLGEGNLDVQVPIRGKDELAQLSDAFNKMVARIREMIQSRDQLLLDVSHELRSPITRMRIALEFVPDSEKKASILADLIHLETMITEILETERIKDGKSHLKLNRVNVSELIREIVPEYKTQKPIDVKLDANLDVMIDRERIRIVLRNCLDNAIKYSKESSKPISVSSETDEGSIKIVIRDFGIGIPEEELPLVFEPFYRVDRSRSKEKGYGLGLSMCQKIMEAHEGQIQIRNYEAGGVEVCLVFKNHLS